MTYRLLFQAAKSIYPENGLKSKLKRLRFVTCGLSSFKTLDQFLGRSSPASLRDTLKQRPQTLGLLIWPYINNDWNTVEKVSALHSHHIEIEKIGWLKIDTESSCVIANLEEVYTTMTLQLDRPIWFMREGELSLNIVIGDTRAYTLAFNLARENGNLVARIGGLQGRNIPEIQQLYQSLTKALHGTRPRDFLLSAFTMLCEEIGVSSIQGVADVCRHHRHPYFGKFDERKTANYDEIWTDRGGKLLRNGFFELPKSLEMRDEDEIPSKKRAMYRRRYEMFDVLRQKIKDTRATLSDHSQCQQLTSGKAGGFII